MSENEEDHNNVHGQHSKVEGSGDKIPWKPPNAHAYDRSDQGMDERMNEMIVDIHQFQQCMNINVLNVSKSRFIYPCIAENVQVMKYV